MIGNPLRRARRKPYSWPHRPPMQEIPLASERWILRWGRILPSLLKNFVRSNPHMIVVGGLFIFLFAGDFINLVTFISLGFFCILFSDHLVDSAKSWHQDRRSKKSPSDNGVRADIFAYEKLSYYQRLAKKQKDPTIRIR